MTQSQYRTQAPVFGKRQGGGVAMQRQYQTPQYQAPQYQMPQSPMQQSNEGYDSKISGRPVKGLRFLSGLIDFCIVSMIGGIILVAQYGLGVSALEMLNGGLLKFYLWFGIVCFIYGLSMESSSVQGTVGKLATGTVVVNYDGQRMSFGQAVKRNLAKNISFIVPLYIGYLMVLFTKKNQSLHDKIADTLVYRKGEGPQSYA